MTRASPKPFGLQPLLFFFIDPEYKMQYGNSSQEHVDGGEKRVINHDGRPQARTERSHTEEYNAGNQGRRDHKHEKRFGNPPSLPWNR
ncbi:hypothetical protein RE428_10610 [Marinobacter nanhaiticus D15-8W]|nr:hypothetical protein RE428_10610 [Marinobacter nanhaiticus D15-8W]